MPDIKRALGNRRFLSGVALILLVIVGSTTFPKESEVLTCDIAVQLVMNALKSESVLFIIPIAGVLPYSKAYLEERQSAFLKIYLIRSRKNTYALNKVFGVLVSGSALWMLGIFSVVVGYWIYYFPQVPMGTIDWSNLELLILCSLRISVISSICALLGAIVSVLTNSMCMTYGLPFVCYYFLIILKEKYFTGLYVWYPKEWVFPSKSWGKQQSGVYIMLFALLIMVMGVYYIVLKEKIRESS